MTQPDQTSGPLNRSLAFRTAGLGTALFLAAAMAACGEAPEPMPTDDPQMTEAPAEQEPAEVVQMDEPSNTIVDVAREAGQFNTLLTAVETAELRPTLQHDGPFTVFAPTDEAFDELPDGAVPALLEDLEELTAVLLYHVVPGTLSAEDVADRSEIETAGGAVLSISVEDGNVFVNGAQVVNADVEAENGVIHVIDGVLMP